MNESLNIGVVQERFDENLAENQERCVAAIRCVRAAGAELILLPELHAGPYFCQVADPAFFDRAETIPGPSTEFYGALAKELDCVIVTSIFEHRAPGLAHNTAVVLERDGSIAGIYRKMHIPDDPGYYEKFYFTPGDLGFEPIDTSVGRLGVLICWDQWYPEAARLMALRGAEVLLYPTAIGWDPRDDQDEQRRQLDAWTTIQRAHAVANGIPVAVANRCGHEPSPDDGPGATFWGNSFISGPQGEILTQTNTDTTTLVTTVNKQRNEDVRRIWPFLRDRRIDAYQGLDKRFLDKDSVSDGQRD